jgi:hypothetical protein
LKISPIRLDRTSPLTSDTASSETSRGTGADACGAVSSSPKNHITISQDLKTRKGPSRRPERGPECAQTPEGPDLDRVDTPPKSPASCAPRLVHPTVEYRTWCTQPPEDQERHPSPLLSITPPGRPNVVGEARAQIHANQRHKVLNPHTTGVIVGQSTRG